MKFVVIGCCGKMGKLVAKDLIEQNVQVYGVDKSVNGLPFKVVKKIEEIDFQIDAIIDFSTASDRRSYIEFARNNKIPYACFSTNVSENDLCEFETVSKEIPVLLSANSSQGVQVLCNAVDMISSNLKDCDVVITEYHHKAKKDAPSGTAKKLESIILQNKKQCQISSFRVGNEVGFHKVEFYFGDEILEISHRANSKNIFALGAIKMVEKLIKKENGIYFNL